MNNRFAALKSISVELLSHRLGRGLVGALAALLLLPLPSLAHHAMGGELPTTVTEGFVSGLAHPVIGLDHLAFVVAVGLLAAVSAWGLAIPIAFVLAAMVGSGLHLAGITLPVAELVVTGSVLGFGVLLVLRERPQSWVMTGLAALAGLFHGYAYGEAIFGAQTMPLGAYLAGFTTVQMSIAIAAFLIGQRLTQGSNPRFMERAGLVICGIGAAFLTTTVVNILLPV
jgi:urease accessory protein